jgi:hypothetical protein
VIINLGRENACAATTASGGELVLPDLWIAPKKSVAKFIRKEMAAPGPDWMQITNKKFYGCGSSCICSMENSRGGTLLCRKRSAPRRESVGVKLHLCWESPECLWRLRVAEHPHQRSDQWRICRRTIRRHVASSRSVRKKSPTSVCRRSLSSTRKTPEQPDSAKRLPTGAAGAAGAAEVAQW